ncbi:MAG TPA: serine hydrolase domain-containing protein, partial [Chloroflexota bacterium]
MTSACPPDGPGAAVIVVREGQVLLRTGYGLANLELQVPVAPHMVFRLGSITKQFTALAILMLLEAGKLALDEPLTTLLPEYPAPSHVVTVEHLLTHTSGIKNLTSMPELVPLWRKDMTLPELIDLFKDLPLEFTPGDRYAYSNSGYLLLGAIIERLSGVSYEQFLRERIFEPLGMVHTAYDHTERIVAGRVSGYQKGKDGLENAPYLSMTQPHAAGALMSSVDDLALWDAALYTERLVRQATLQRAFTPYLLANGVSTGYGYGWGITSHEGHPIIEHSGGIHGFLSDAKRLPADRLFVAVLMNSMLGNPPPDFPAMQIAAAALGLPYQQPATLSLEPALLQRYEGVYQDQEGEHEERTVRCKDDHLALGSAQGGEADLFPLSAEAFFFKHSFARVTFHLDAAGTVQSLER